MDDLISRRAALEAIKSRKTAEQSSAGIMRNAVVDFCIDIVKKLPSAQPEIIHCKECKYGVQDEDKRWYCRGLGCQVGEADGSGFCADAERRTDDSASTT